MAPAFTRAVAHANAQQPPYCGSFSPPCGKESAESNPLTGAARTSTFNAAPAPLRGRGRGAGWGRHLRGAVKPTLTTPPAMHPLRCTQLTSTRPLCSPPCCAQVPRHRLAIAALRRRRQEGAPAVVVSCIHALCVISQLSSSSLRQPHPCWLPGLAAGRLALPAMLVQVWAPQAAWGGGYTLSCFSDLCSSSQALIDAASLLHGTLSRQRGVGHVSPCCGSGHACGNERGCRALGARWWQRPGASAMSSQAGARAVLQQRAGRCCSPDG